MILTEKDIKILEKINFYLKELYIIVKDIKVELNQVS